MSKKNIDPSVESRVSLNSWKSGCESRSSFTYRNCWRMK